MNVEKVMEWLSEFPKDYDVVLSETHVLSEENDLVAIIDTPIIGLTRSDESKEVRFMIRQQEESFNSILDELKY